MEWKIYPNTSLIPLSMLFFVGINYSCTLSLHLRINSIFMKIPRANSCLVDSFLTPKIIFFFFLVLWPSVEGKNLFRFPRDFTHDFVQLCFLLPSRYGLKLLVGHQYCDCRRRRRGDGRRRRRRRKLMSFITLTTIATHKRERKKALNFSKMSSHRWWLLNLLLPCQHISPIYDRFHLTKWFFPLQAPQSLILIFSSQSENFLQQKSFLLSSLYRFIVL